MKRRLPTFWLFTLALAIEASSVSGQVGVAPGPKSDGPVRDRPAPLPVIGTATIAGVVRSDGQDPRPVRRAVVEARSSEPSFRRFGITDEDGRFELAQLPAGRYQVSISKPGYVRTYYGARAGHQSGLLIALRDGQQVRDLAPTIAPGAVITGRVTDESGRPVEGTLVFVAERRLVNGVTTYGTSSANPHSAVSDDRGIYRVHSIPAGSYMVLVSSPPAVLRGPLLSVKMAPTPSAVISEARIAASSPTARTYAPVFYPGVADPTAAAVVQVRAGEELGGIDFPLPLVVTSRVTGTVTRADGAPPSNVELFALPVGAPVKLGIYGVALADVRRAKVESSGAFAIEDLPPGRYTLTARAPSRAVTVRGEDGVAALLDLWASAEITVSGAPIGGLSLLMQRAATISGRVVFEGATPPAPGDVVQTLLRLVAPPNPGPTIRPPSGAVEADRSFAIQGAAPGVYRLSGFAPGMTAGRSTWTLRSVVADGRDLLDSPFEIRPGQDIGSVVATFTDRVADLSGVVIDQTGRPVSDVFVLVFSSNQAYWQVRARRVPAPVRPDSSGRYRITALPPGEYYLAAIQSFDPEEYATPAFLEQVVPGAIKITIGEGEKKTQDIKLGI